MLQITRSFGFSLRSLRNILIWIFIILIGFLTSSDTPSDHMANSRVYEKHPRFTRVDRFGQIPLHFEANQGQTHETVRFLSRGPGFTLFLAENEVVLALEEPDEGFLHSERHLLPENMNKGNDFSDSRPVSHGARSGGSPPAPVLRMQLVGGDPTPEVTGLDELPGRSHYFIGNDPDRWRSDVSHYAKVRYTEVYPDIDILYYGHQGVLEYDFIVKPGASPEDILFDVEGSQSCRIDHQGNLVLDTHGGEVVLRRPRIYQVIDHRQKSIPGEFVMKGENRVGFDVDSYDTEKDLVIDPELIYSTYLGGSSYYTAGRGVAVDDEGYAYVTGRTAARNFPVTEGAFQTEHQGNRAYADDYEVFVTKLNPEGSALVYSTYIGGEEYDDEGLDIAIDTAGCAYITGVTWSEDFPTTQGAYQTASADTSLSEYWSSHGDAFIVKLNSEGSDLIYSTYLGSKKIDYAAGIAVDESGCAYVAGHTCYGWEFGPFPTTTGAYKEDDSSLGIEDGFAAKLTADGSDLVYATLLDLSRVSSNDEVPGASDIAVDPQGAAYVSCKDHVIKLNASGTGLVYRIVLKGSLEWRADVGYGIAIDEALNCYVTGKAMNLDFPTTESAYQGTHGDAAQPFVRGDAFAAKLNPAGDVVYSTLLGGDQEDLGGSIIVDDGIMAVMGWTASANFPTKEPIQPELSGYSDHFVAMIDPSQSGESSLVFSTYLGGSGHEWDPGAGHNETIPNVPYVYSRGGIDADGKGGIYVTGFAGSFDFSTSSGAYDTTGLNDAFIAKFGSTMDFYPDGVAYDPNHWDKDVGELQSSFSDLRITGSGLETVDEVIFKLDGEVDVYVEAQNIKAYSDSVTFDLIVVHGSDLGERDIVLRKQDGTEIDVTGQAGRGFIVSRMRNYFNQAVDQNELPTLRHRDILIAEKRGVVKIEMDDPSQNGKSFTAVMHLKDFPFPESSDPSNPYVTADSYTEQEIIDGKDFLPVSMPGPPSEGNYIFKCVLTRDDNKVLFGPDIEREFVKSGPLRIMTIRLRLQNKADGTLLDAPLEPSSLFEVANAVDFVRKVYPVSDSQFRFQDVGSGILDPKYPLQTSQWGEREIYHLSDEDQIDLIEDLDERLDEVNKSGVVYNILAAFLPEKALWSDEDGDGRVDSYTAGLTLTDSRAVLITPIRDSAGRTIEMNCTLAHEVGHNVRTAAAAAASENNTLGGNLGDEYKFGGFECDINPPIRGNINEEEEKDCEDSPYLYSVHGDSSATYTDRSAFDSWDMKPMHTYIGIEKSVKRYNFMGNQGPDSVDWVSLRSYDEMLLSMAPGAPASAKIASDPILTVRGMIYDEGTGEFGNFALSEVGMPSPATFGPYQIELQDESGSPLTSHPFDANFLMRSNPPRTMNRAFFRFQLKMPAGAKQVVLKKDGQVLASRTLSDHPPIVSITSPSQGASLSEKTTIRWTASDPDNDPLEYSIYYMTAADKWMPVTSDLTDTYYEFDPLHYEVTSNGSIVVVASDGLNTGEDRVGDLKVHVQSDKRDQKSRPGTFQLAQNYPNPFNASTRISYVISESAGERHVELKIYNALGADILTLVDEKQRPGRYEVRWHGQNGAGEFVPSGLYFYVLNAGGLKKVGKMLLLR